MKPGERIPTPWKHRWRRFRYGAMPGICFAACVMLTLWLWQDQGRLPNAVGEVETLSVPIAAGIDGILESRIPREFADLLDREAETWWTRFEPVKKGELIARLDSSTIEAALTVLKVDRLRLDKEIDAAAEQLKLDMLNLTLGDPVDVARAQLDYVMDFERLRLEVVDRMTEIAGDRIAYQRLDAKLGFLEDLADKGVAVEMQLVDIELSRDETKKRIDGNTVAVEETKDQLKRAEQRHRELPERLAVDGTDGVGSIDIKTILAPLAAEINTQEARIDALRHQIELLEIRAPFAGTISEVHLWPKQHVQAGDPIVTLARAEGDGAQYIVSYLRQEQRLRPMKDMSVDLRIRMPGARAIAARIAEVGPQFVPIPLRQLADPARPEFGLPVRILVPEKMKSMIHPGELIDVRFQR